jgi:hypothetical protein
MADANFPGFEGEDEEEKPAKPAAKPAVPAKPAAPAKPPTGKVAKGDATAPTLQGAGSVDYQFEESSEEPAPKKKAYAPPPAEAAPPPTPVAPSPGKGARGSMQPAIEADVDPDLKPGSRKDLWTCPHCGTGNKPGRDTCRKCGKSPDDVVVVPLFKRPPVIGAAAGGVVLLIVLIAMVFGGTDLTLKPAEVSSIDSKARIGGSASGTHDIDGHTFTARKQISVCGRCVGSMPMQSPNGGLTVVLLLGKPAKDDDLVKACEPTFNGELTDLPSAPGKFVILHLLSTNKLDATRKGQVVSLVGEVGDLDPSVGSSGEYTVWVQSLQTG